MANKSCFKAYPTKLRGDSKYHLIFCYLKGGLGNVGKPIGFTLGMKGLVLKDT